MEEKCKTEGRRRIKWRMLLPTVILITIAVLAGGTDVFSKQVHEIVFKGVRDQLLQMVPYLVNLVFAVGVLNLFWLVHHRCKCAVEGLFKRFKGAQPLSGLGVRVFNICYWASAVLFAAAFFAPQLMAQLAAGLTFLTAALTVALQGLIKDFYAGLMLQGPDGLQEGEDVKIADVSIAEGKVVKIGHIKSTIKSKENGLIVVSNSKIWDSAVARPPKPKIILPDGYNPEEEKTSDKVPAKA